jgi:hypothetical protein
MILFVSLFLNDKILEMEDIWLGQMVAQGHGKEEVGRCPYKRAAVDIFV